MTAILTPPLPAVGLTPYAGAFGTAEAAHLLRRTLMGPKRSEIRRAVDRGLSATLSTLLAPAPPPPPPVNHFFEDDPNVGIGESWVDSPHLENADVGNYRWPSLRGWYMNGLIDSPTRITEKMALFWMNHFGMSDVGEHRAQYQYIQLFRRFATGNFRTLIERITVHPSMLAFLNGRYNRKGAPDENYAREMLELFTVQKGRPGDVNYTEEDVRACARVLTGWRVRGFWSREDEAVESYFQDDWHDTEPKQLSSYFGNATIENGGPDEYKTLIGIVFQHPETARAICRDLYIYFVDHRIDDGVESGVIRPLADLLVASDFELAPVLENLLGSAHFFDRDRRGAIIKNPYEFMLSVARPLGGYGHLGLDLNLTYNLGNAYHWLSRNMDMDFLYIPTVSGWKAYYQTPGYYRNWIGSTTLQKRQEVAEAMTGNGIWTEGKARPLDWLRFVDDLSEPSNADALLEEVTGLFLAAPLHPDQLAILKAELTGGLGNMEWERQYREYRNGRDNAGYVDAILRRVRAMFRLLVTLPEFHLQ